MPSESFDALFSDAGVELNHARTAARRIIASCAEDLGDNLQDVEAQRELEGLIACLVSQIEKAAQRHEQAELAHMRETKPAEGSLRQRLRMPHIEAAAATLTDAVRTLESIGFRLRDQENDEASAVLSVVAALREADGALEEYLSGRAAG
ncbi:hypothetical protein [Sediminicurvatus halobius]|uniref:Uncharacterized protein n=1 Tax=Sediminicurvatus halobius TaxID=2182432 RepID=A0A2U2MWB6_9GAMM|nr:hypothetical protein [Spiribacter halobius]PWG61155.1 hypothetical protein DEM34_17965 [Spiribacter halobius]UEX78633.1 hypothetical protein LMH63_03020 [Spiribacter halobius]